MATGCVLTLDQGGHASRAALYSPAGERLAAAAAPLATHRPRPGWVEHDPDELIASLHKALADLAVQAIGSNLAPAAAGLATQRSSIVLWERRSGRALSPVLSWQDTRHAAWLAALGLDIHHIRALTGLVPSPHYGASKLRWGLDHLPAARAALDRGDLCGGPLAAFILSCLLTERPAVCDPANASRTLLWDIRNGDWSPELLAAFGLPRAMLPDLVPNRHPFGTLPFAGRCVPLTVVTGDQSAALFASGTPDAVASYINLGTGAFVQRLAAIEGAAAAGLLASVVFADRKQRQTVLEGTVNGAGAALDWLAERHDRPAAGWLPHLDAWLDGIDAPPLFLNGIGGLGSPWWRADAPCRFIDPGGASEPAGTTQQLAREAVAVIESIVFMLAVNCECLAAAAGPFGALRVSGGLSRLDGLCRRLAALTGCPVKRSPDLEATGRGLAWLLAEPRTAWRTAAGTLFHPAPDAPLHSRFQAWRAGLEAALGGGAGSGCQGRQI